MKTINILTFVLALAMILVLTYMNPTPYYTYITKYGPITHDEALTMCEDLGLEYDYEAEGYTVEDFCVMTEAQAE